MRRTPNPSTYDLVKWLASITKSVHAPLLISTLFRIITQTLDIAMFSIAGWTLAVALLDRLPVGGLITIVILALLRALTHYFEQFTGHYVAFKALEVLRGYAFSKLWPKAPGITVRQHSGSLLTNLTRDVDRIEVVYAHTFAPLVSAVLVPTLALSFAGYHFGFAVIAIPLSCVLISIFFVPTIGFQRSAGSTDATLMRRGELSSHISDSIHGVSEVLTYGRQNARIEEMALIDDDVRATSLAPARVKATRRATNLALNLISIIGVVAISVASGLHPVWAVALVLGTARLFEAPKGIESAVGYLDHSFSAAQRLWELCHTPENIVEGSRQLSLDRAPNIEWVKTTYCYPGTSHKALDQVSFSAQAGQHTIIMGQSGSGKSTAIQLLLRFDELESGSILIDGEPITDFTSDSIRSAIALVSQKSQVLTGSIADNLRLGAPDASDDELYSALSTACFAKEVRAMPEQLKTQVGTGGSELSGGQLQRLALARALLIQPKVLVLDEFTANLNTELEAEIRAELASSYPDLTVIEVSHRTENLDHADHVFIFEHGRVHAR